MPSATSAPPAAPSPTAWPDVLATATANNCAMTPYTNDADPAAGGDGRWYEQAGFELYVVADDAGAWYAGGQLIFATSSAAGTLEINTRRLDGSGAPLSLSAQVTATQGFAGNLTLAEPGCWEITVKLRDAPELLRVTVFVQPPTARPELAALIARHAALVPYPPPADCATTPLGDPKLRRVTVEPDTLEYTIAGQGLSLRGDLSLLYDGVNELRWAPAVWSDIQVTGASLADPAITLRSDMMRSVDANGEFWRATTLFPAPGCWQLHAVAGTQTLDATVYVYPAECLPATSAATTTVACEPPS
jgi:hypothetical protein